jgi:hypothetical protein
MLASIDLTDHGTHLFQSAFGFKRETRKIEGLDSGELACKTNESWVFGKIGLLGFGVSISDPVETAEQITESDDAHQGVVFRGFIRAVVVSNHVRNLGRQMPDTSDDLACLFVTDPKLAFFGLVQRDVFGTRQAQRCGKLLRGYGEQRDDANVVK